MNKRTLFLPIEIVARELDAKLLISYFALEKGFSIVIGTKGDIYKIALSLKSGIFFYKDHSSLSSEMLQELSAVGLRVVAMDEEGLSWPSSEIYKKRIDYKALQISDAIFAWGQKQYDLITQKYPEYYKKCLIIGNPRFDILHTKYRTFLNDRAKYQLQSSEEGYILINSMFTPGNWNSSLYGTPSYVDHMRDRGFIKNDEDLNFYTKVSENAEQLFHAYVSMIKNLSNIFTNIKFVIRPHPDENQEKWRNIFSSTNNVVVECRGSAIYWILGSKALITSGCTTSIEAWALGKPTLRYHPIPETKFGPYLPNRFSKNLTNEKDLVKEIKLILDSQECDRYDVDPEYVRSYIKNIHTADAAENIVKVLDSLFNNNVFKGKEHISFYKKLKKEVYLLFRFKLRKRWISRIFNKLKRLLSKSAAEKELKIKMSKSQKFPGLTHQDIENFLVSLDKNLGKDSKRKYEITSMSKNTYRIEKIIT